MRTNKRRPKHGNCWSRSQSSRVSKRSQRIHILKRINPRLTHSSQRRWDRRETTPKRRMLMTFQRPEMILLSSTRRASNWAFNFWKLSFSSSTLSEHCSPAKQAAVERLLSQGGGIFCKKRHLLKYESFEKQLLLKISIGYLKII